MADLTTQLADLNANAKNLLQKYDGAFSKIENLSEQKQKELSDFVSKQVEAIKNSSGNIDIDKIKKEIDDKVKNSVVEKAKVAENALKLGGKSLEELGLIKKKINKEAISINTTLESLKDLYDCSEIESTFYKDSSKGIGWGTNDNKWKWLKIPVPNGSTQIKITFSGRYDGSGLGYLDIKNDNDKSLLNFHDAWTDASEGQSLSINGKEIIHKQTKNLENYTATVNLNGSNYIKIGMTGYTSSYPYNKRFIKSLIFN